MKKAGRLQWVIFSSSWEDEHVSKVKEICRRESVIQSQPEEKRWSSLAGHSTGNRPLMSHINARGW